MIAARPGVELCSECAERQREAYERVERVLAATPDISPAELAQRANVTRSVLKRLAKKGLIIMRPVEESRRCQRCGREMDGVDRFCGVCKTELLSQAKQAASSLQNRVPYGQAGEARKTARKKPPSSPSDFGARGKYSPPI
jgi:protein-arginine kinase activator protein McsA